MQDESNSSEPLPTIFICYARKNNDDPDFKQRWLDKLLDHLKPLEYQNEAIVWCDQRLEVGNFWDRDIQAALRSAKVAIALLSPAFFASSYIRFEEMPMILQQVDEGKTKLLPILLSACDVRGSKFRYGSSETEQKERSLYDFQASNGLNQPLMGLSESEQDAILLRVAERAREIVTGKKSETSDREKSKLETPNNLPYSGVTKFVGREEALETLHEQFQQGQTIAISAISGMGGIGKTELAWHYADRQARAGDFPGGVCWLRARDEVGTQILGFVRSHLDLNPPMEGDLESQVRWCWQHWRSGEALIVFDDVQKFEEVRSFLPPRGSRFKVLMTSRSRFGSPVQTHEIEVLSEDAALDLLRAIVREDGIDRELETAKQLCQWLGYLPLAIELVGRYWVRNRDWSLAKLLQVLKQKELQAKAFVRTSGMSANHESLAAAFELSWEALSAEAQQLGAFLSVLALVPIPWEMVEAALEGCDEEEVREARSQLVDFSLLTEAEIGWFELHPLTRLFFKSKLSGVEAVEEWKRSLCQVAARVCQQIEQTITIQRVQELASVMPHLEIVARELAQNYCEEEDLIWTITGVGWFYQGQGLYQQAEEWLEQCLQVTRDRLGVEHPAVAASLNNLAGLYKSQGRYGDAEPLLQQALELTQYLLGVEHPAVATSLNNLALLYDSQGRYGDAEPLLQQALELRQHLLGVEHPHVADSLNNLASLYHSQGRYREAEPLYQQALELRQHLLGAEHPHVASSLNNLAGLYRSQGRYRDAESLYQQALELRQHLLGAEHPAVADSLNNLAGLYDSQGRYRDAEPLLQQALQLMQHLLGAEHPHVATSLNNLASLYKSQGRYREAEPFYQQALQIHLKALGEDHPDLAIDLGNLAELYTTLERYAEAEPLFHRAIAVFDQRLGESHPYTRETIRRLTNLIAQAIQAGRSHELSDHSMTRSLLQQLQSASNE